MISLLGAEIAPRTAWIVTPQQFKRRSPPSRVSTSHRVALRDAPQACKTFRDKKDQCIKVVLDHKAA